jgi:hypothetical protein
MTPRKTQASALGGTVGVGDQAYRDRFAETTLPTEHVYLSGPHCFARIKSAFKMNNIQRADITLLHGLWMTELHFAKQFAPARNGSFLLVHALDQISHAVRELGYFSLSLDVESDCAITPGSAINCFFQV